MGEFFPRRDSRIYFVGPTSAVGVFYLALELNKAQQKLVVKSKFSSPFLDPVPSATLENAFSLCFTRTLILVRDFILPTMKSQRLGFAVE